MICKVSLMVILLLEFRNRNNHRTNKNNKNNNNGTGSLIQVASSTIQNDRVATVKQLIVGRSLRSLPPTPTPTPTPTSLPRFKQSVTVNSSSSLSSSSSSLFLHFNTDNENRQHQHQQHHENCQLSSGKLSIDRVPEVFPLQQQQEEEKEEEEFFRKTRKTKQNELNSNWTKGLIDGNRSKQPETSACQQQEPLPERNDDDVDKTTTTRRQNTERNVATTRRIRLHRLQSIRFQRQPKSNLISYPYATISTTKEPTRASIREPAGGGAVAGGRRIEIGIGKGREIEAENDSSDSSDTSDSSDSSCNSCRRPDRRHNVLLYPSRESFDSLPQDPLRPDLLKACCLITQRNKGTNSNQDNSSFYSSINHYERLECLEHQYEIINEPVIADQRGLIQKIHEMGQSLSLRRPRISLTWVLREQQQQSQSQQETQQPEKLEQSNQQAEQVTENSPKVASAESASNELKTDTTIEKSFDNNNDLKESERTLNAIDTTASTLNVSMAPKDLINGYATTPSAHAASSDVNAFLAHKFFSNKNLLHYSREEISVKPASKDLLFVCTPQHVPESLTASTDALAFAKKRHEVRKKLAAKKSTLRSDSYPLKLMVTDPNGRGKAPLYEQQQLSLLPVASYSEPSLIAASEGNPRRHRHRKRRERQRGQKFGYEIRNVEEFLTKCSLISPANIPMVLSTACILYQTRPGGYQTELPLPLGMVVNAVFKNQMWLYVQTPHSEEGYVSYGCCLPLGILPPEARGQGVGSARPPPCWESNGDIFPRPCGNMTDSEKELHFINGNENGNGNGNGNGDGGPRSEGAHTPHLKPLPPLKSTTKTCSSSLINRTAENLDPLSGELMLCGEQQVDKLYLKAASQTKLHEMKPAYAQLKLLRNASIHDKSNVNSGDYVILQQKQQQPQQRQQHHNVGLFKQKCLPYGTIIGRTFPTNDFNGQHLHPNDMNLSATSTSTATAKAAAVTVAASTVAKVIPKSATITTSNGIVAASAPALQQQQHYHHHYHQKQQHNYHYNHNHTHTHRNILNVLRRSSTHCGQRQTLVAITVNYTTTDGVHLQKGDIVTLCECREGTDQRQWFYVRTRDGRQGYIPAEVAGHGYL